MKTKQDIRKSLPALFPDHQGGPARNQIVGPIFDGNGGTFFVVRSRTRANGQRHHLYCLSAPDGRTKLSEILSCREQATAERMAQTLSA